MTVSGNADRPKRTVPKAGECTVGAQEPLWVFAKAKPPPWKGGGHPRPVWHHKIKQSIKPKAGREDNPSGFCGAYRRQCPHPAAPVPGSARTRQRPHAAAPVPGSARTRQRLHLAVSASGSVRTRQCPHLAVPAPGSARLPQAQPLSKIISKNSSKPVDIPKGQWYIGLAVNYYSN